MYLCGMPTPYAAQHIACYQRHSMPHTWANTVAVPTLSGCAWSWWIHQASFEALHGCCCHHSAPLQILQWPAGSPAALLHPLAHRPATAPAAESVGVTHTPTKATSTLLRMCCFRHAWKSPHVVQKRVIRGVRSCHATASLSSTCPV